MTMIVFANDKMNSEKYQDMIEPPLINFGEKLYGL